MRRCQRSGGVLLIIVALVMLPTITVSLQNTAESNDLHLRPYSERVVYSFDEDLEDAEIYRGGDLMLNDDHYLRWSLSNLDGLIGLRQFVDVELSQTTGNGYWCIDFNPYNNYPLNISGFRRAFAYAFDKTRVTSEFPAGLFNVHDSVVPETSTFCIENELDWHYYSNRADIGNQILDDLGFAINSTSGWRDDPNGDPIKIDIGPRDTSSYIPNTMHYPPIIHSIGHAAEDALNELHINAEYPDGFWWYSPSDAELIIDDTYFDGDNIDWLGNYHTFSSFSNSTFQGCLDNLLSETSYDAVFAAGAEIQKILHYNVPRLVICSGLLIHPYRTDDFVGVIEDVIRGASGIWSLCNVRNKYPSIVDPVRVSFQSRIYGFNIYTDYNPQTKPFFENIWPTLFTIGPGLELVPNLAKSITSETHADNSAVPEGHTL